MYVHTYPACTHIPSMYTWTYVNMYARAFTAEKHSLNPTEVLDMTTSTYTYVPKMSYACTHVHAHVYTLTSCIVDICKYTQK